VQVQILLESILFLHAILLRCLKVYQMLPGGLNTSSEVPKVQVRSAPLDLELIRK